MIIPIELWLLIFRYTDTETLNNILIFLKSVDSVFHNRLLSIICYDTVKYNKKILQMIKLVKTPYNFRYKRNYLNFRNVWVNKSDNKFPFCFSGYIDVYNVKKYILNNNLFKYEDDKKLFQNLTSDYCHRFYEEEECNNNTLKYYNNKLPIETVIQNILLL